MNSLRTLSLLLALFIAATLLGPQTRAQPVNFVLSGYGTTGYEARLADSSAHDFGASFSPVGLFKMGDDVLFESELDFGLHDGTTSLSLEHAQVHYLGWNRVQFTAGKFHLPFGIWMHPTWINKMPDPPLLYGHAHSGVAEEALLPILFDVGAKAMSKISLGSGWSLGTSLWISQGPKLVAETGEEGHEHAAAPETALTEEEPHLEIPRVGYGISFPDNNENKMVGGRLRFMNRTNMMIGLAGFYARYDPAGELGITGTNLSLKWQPGRYDLRGEGILLWQQVAHHEEEETARKGGYYLQLTRRIRAYEPVVRWSHLPASTLEGAPVQSERRQLAFGLNYWITPSIPLKASYQWALDGPDGVRLQWAFGF